MQEQLIIVAAPHDVHPGAGHGACGQGGGHVARTFCLSQWLQFQKSEKTFTKLAVK